ncbi:hypothetical protein CEK28_03770 [Xenophilus sp. AP218F]|nr:hypothetical protein CEK28_03770 [Xenophilus sp. AP218F]
MPQLLGCHKQLRQRQGKLLADTQWRLANGGCIAAQNGLRARIRVLARSLVNDGGAEPPCGSTADDQEPQHEYPDCCLFHLTTPDSSDPLFAIVGRHDCCDLADLIQGEEI